MPKTVFKTLPLNTEIVFRLATVDDLPHLEWSGEYIHFRRVFEYTYQQQVLGKRWMLLADFNDFPVGQVFITTCTPQHPFSRTQPYGYIYSLRVMQAFQGMGIGTQLILEAEKLIRQRGFALVTIAVAKENHYARRLYEKLDYRIYAEDDGKWSYIDHQGNEIHVHEPCWLLEKHLPAQP